MAKYPEIFDYFSVADRVNGDHFHHGAIFLEGDGDEKLVSHFFHFLVNQCFRLRLYMHTTYLFTYYLVPMLCKNMCWFIFHFSERACWLDSWFTMFNGWQTALRHFDFRWCYCQRHWRRSHCYSWSCPSKTANCNATQASPNFQAQLVKRRLLAWSRRGLLIVRQSC